MTQHVVAWAFLFAVVCGVIALVAVAISDRFGRRKRRRKRRT